MRLLSIEQIKRNSEELNQLNRQLLLTAGTHSKQHDENCRVFHSRFDDLVYPGGGAMLVKVREGNAIALENALRFLTADPIHFRSGYLKEHLWRWLQHINLSQNKLDRLEIVALSYLNRRTSREFWNMAKAMHRLARPKFWLEVALTAEQLKSPSSIRASYLLAHGVNLHTGALLRRELYQRWIAERWGGS